LPDSEYFGQYSPNIVVAGPGPIGSRDSQQAPLAIDGLLCNAICLGRPLRAVTVLAAPAIGRTRHPSHCSTGGRRAASALAHGPAASESRTAAAMAALNGNDDQAQPEKTVTSVTAVRIVGKTTNADTGTSIGFGSLYLTVGLECCSEISGVEPSCPRPGPRTPWDVIG
jgi:hypothetical protein